MQRIMLATEFLLNELDDPFAGIVKAAARALSPGWCRAAWRSRI